MDPPEGRALVDARGCCPTRRGRADEEPVLEQARESGASSRARLSKPQETPARHRRPPASALSSTWIVIAAVESSPPLIPGCALWIRAIGFAAPADRALHAFSTSPLSFNAACMFRHASLA